MNPLRLLLLLAACVFTATGAFAKTPPKKAPAPQAPPADAPPMDWPAFVKAAQHGHAHEAAAQAIAELQRQIKKKAPGVDWRIFAGACSLADDQQLAALRELLLQYPADDPQFAFSFTAYASARFRRYTQRLHDTHAKITLPAPRDPLPEDIAADPEVKRAWLAWHRAVDAFAALQATESPAPPAGEAEPPTLAAALRQSLAAPDLSAAHRLPAALEQDEKSGHQEEAYGEIPMHRGLLLALLDSPHPAEALGAALHQPFVSDQLAELDGSDSLPQPTPFHESVEQFLAACGLDLEEVYAGAMLPSDAGPDAGGGVVLGDLNSWELLATRGSPRGVRLGLAVLRKAHLDSGDGMRFLFRALGLFYERDLLPRQVKLPKDTRREVVDTFGWYLSADRPVDELNRTLSLVPSPIIADLRPALEKLARHPSYVIARRARELMKFAHLSLQGLPAMPAPPPLRIHILADGQPVAKTKFTADFPSHAWFEIETDADGWAEVPTGDELHPEAIALVHLKTIAPPLVKDEHWPGPWLDFTVKVNGQIDRPYTASLTTASLEITLDPQGPVPVTSPAHLAVIHTPDAEDLWLEHEPELTLPFTGSITLDHLPPGPCCVAVSADGAATAYSKTIDIGKNGSARLVRLERGREVRVSVTVPKDHDSGYPFHPQFRQNGKLFKAPATADGQGWTAFPVGKFQLFIPWVEYGGPKPGQTFLRDASTVPANGLDTDVTADGEWTHDFEITSDSPALIDLGPLQLTKKEKE